MLKAKLVVVNKEPSVHCQWVKPSKYTYGEYTAGCGKSFTVFGGDLDGLGFIYCPFCGFEIVEAME